MYNIDNLIIFYLKTSFLGKRKVRFRKVNRLKTTFQLTSKSDFSFTYSLPK